MAHRMAIYVTSKMRPNLNSALKATESRPKFCFFQSGINSSLKHMYLQNKTNFQFLCGVLMGNTQQTNDMQVTLTLPILDVATHWGIPICIDNLGKL